MNTYRVMFRGDGARVREYEIDACTHAVAIRRAVERFDEHTQMIGASSLLIAANIERTWSTPKVRAV